MNIDTKESTATPVVLGWGVAWVGAYLGALIVLKGTGLPELLRLPVALAPAPFFLGFLIAMLRAVQRMDELHRRIQLEALAVAFPVAIVIAMLFGLAQRAGYLLNESFADNWFIVVIPYFAGVALARRRYL